MIPVGSTEHGANRLCTYFFVIEGESYAPSSFGVTDNTSFRFYNPDHLAESARRIAQIVADEMGLEVGIYRSYADGSSKRYDGRYPR